MSVRYELHEHIARVTIDRPDVLNAIDASTETELLEIWSELENEPDARVIVLTGAGEKAFCVGADMKSTEDAATGLEYWAKPRPGRLRRHRACGRRSTFPSSRASTATPLGGGFEMVLGCDIVVACEGAKFGFPEPLVGRLAARRGHDATAPARAREVGDGRAPDGQAGVSAEEAERVGLVNEVAPRAELDTAVDRWVEQMLACAPLSLRAIKQSVKQHRRRSPPSTPKRCGFPR